MRLVLDTNVFISGLFWNNASTKILELWNTKEIQLITSLGMILELKKFLVTLKLNILRIWKKD